MASIAWSRADRLRVRCPAQPANPSALWAGGLVGYALICRFASFLFCGELIGMSRVPFQPPEIFRWPVSVLEFPIHTVVLALTLGTWLLIPPMVSVLARRRWGLAYAIMAACLGPSLVMGIMLMGAALAADLRLVRQVLPRRALTAGLLFPIGCAVVWILRAWVVGAAATDGFLLLLPLGLAVLYLLTVSLLWPAPGILTSRGAQGFLALLIVPPALAAILFRSTVGIDEVAFPILERQWGLQSGHFVSVPLGAILPHVEQWDREIREPPWESRRSVESTLAAFLAMDYLHAAQAEKTARFRQFLARFPGSRHQARALYHLALALDARVDVAAITRHRRLRFDHGEVSAEGRRQWFRLAEDYPSTPYAAVAFWRLAQAQLRDGDLAGAQAHLNTAVERFGPPADALPREPDAWTGAYRGPIDTHDFLLEERYLAAVAVAHARHLLRFLQRHQDHPRILADFCRLRPRHFSYAAELQALAQQPAYAPLEEDIQLALVLEQGDDRARAEALLAFWNAHRASPAGEAALVELVRAKLGQAQWNPDGLAGRRVDLARASHYGTLFLKTYEASPLAPVVLSLMGRIAQERQAAEERR